MKYGLEFEGLLLIIFTFDAIVQIYIENCKAISFALKNEQRL